MDMIGKLKYRIMIKAMWGKSIKKILRKDKY